MSKFILVLLSIALLVGFASAATNQAADEAALSKLISSLEDNLSLAALDDIEESDSLATGATGMSTGMSGSTGMGKTFQTANFPPAAVNSKCMFSVSDLTLPEYAGSTRVRFECSDSVNMPRTFDLTCYERVMTPSPTTGEDWNYYARTSGCPDQITLPAGQMFVTMDVSAFDNEIQDGDATLTIVANGMNVVNGKEIVTIHIVDDDVAVPAAMYNPTRCDPRWPAQISARFMGDRLANQFYTQKAPRGMYFCIYEGVTDNTWAFGIRAASTAAGAAGTDFRFQLWWNNPVFANGGQIRYESINPSPLDGILGPYRKVNGFNPAGEVLATRVSDAETYACLSVTGAGDTGFNQLYAWEDTMSILVRFRGISTRTHLLIATPATTTDFNTGFWYFVQSQNYTPYYSSIARGGVPQGSYKVGASVVATSAVPTVMLSSACPARPVEVCVAARGSTWFKVNQIYKMAVSQDPRLTIHVGITYPAWAISKMALGAEDWSDYHFISYQATTLYYANKRGVDIVSSYYSITRDEDYQGTVTVASVVCPYNGNVMLSVTTY